MNFEYFLSIFFIFFSFLLAAILFLVLYLLIFRQVDFEKVSAYECGFNPFEDAREPFEIHFYLVAILFIIFDLEISFLFPWVLVFRFINLFAFLMIIIFLFILKQYKILWIG